MTFQDSGERTEFETGARRDAQDGKGRMDLLPWRAIMEVSKIYEDGCLKYGDRNWEKGIPLSRYADSGPRHFGKWMAGMDDEPHLKMAIWNFLSMLDTILRIKEGVLPETLNDLPCCPDLAPEVTPPIVGDIIDLEKMDEFLFRIGKTKVVAETEWPLDCMPALKAAVEANPPVTKEKMRAPKYPDYEALMTEPEDLSAEPEPPTCCCNTVENVQPFDYLAYRNQLVMDATDRAMAAMKAEVDDGS